MLSINKNTREDRPTPVSSAANKKIKANKCWQECKDGALAHCQRERGLMQPLEERG